MERDRADAPGPRHAASPVYGRIIAILIAGTVLAGMGMAFFQLRKPQPSPGPVLRSLAIIPLGATNEGDTALGLAMADTLITRLGHLPGVTAAPLSVARRYSAPRQDPLAAARRLGVEAVVTGRIQLSGGRLAGDLRLVRVSDARIVWTDRFDDRSAALFEVQDRVVAGLAEAVLPSLTDSARERTGRRATSDLDAYLLYASGLLGEPLDAARAGQRYQRAIERDVRFAAAWAALARTQLHRASAGGRSAPQLLDDARKSARNAIALDPLLSDPHLVLGTVYAEHEWRWDYAEVALRRAIELSPANAAARSRYATFAAHRRKFDVALEHSALAMELDPDALPVQLSRGLCLRLSGKSAEAVAHLETALRTHEKASELREQLALASADMGKPALGAQWLGSAPPPALAAYLAARDGRRQDALLLLQKLQPAADSVQPAPMIALAWCALGDHDRAFLWLERAFAERDRALLALNAEPGFAAMRSDARYADLIRRMGL